MKKIILTFSIVTIFLIACEKKEKLGPIQNGTIEAECTEMSANTDWTTEKFKVRYSIQFPNNYEGPGVIAGFEGNTYFKKRLDDNIRIIYSYCGPTYCDDFGDSLALPFPNSITANDTENNQVNLASKQEFCLNGEVVGVFYYNTEVNATGKYFMKRDAAYLEGTTIFYSNSEFQEVENIIKTISEN
jgi:hypothetical protein